MLKRLREERKKKVRKEILACTTRMFPRTVWDNWRGKGKLLQKRLKWQENTHLVLYWFKEDLFPRNMRESMSFGIKQNLEQTNKQASSLFILDKIGHSPESKFLHL